MSSTALEALDSVNPGRILIQDRAVPTFSRHLSSPGRSLPGDTNPDGSNPAPAEPRIFPGAFLAGKKQNIKY